MELRYLVNVDPQGNMRGAEIEQIKSDLRDHFGGSFVVVSISGPVKKPRWQDRSFYFAILLPAIIRKRNNNGDLLLPHERSDIGKIDAQLRSKFLPPVTKTDTMGNPIEMTRTFEEISAGQFELYLMKCLI